MQLNSGHDHQYNYQVSESLRNVTRIKFYHSGVLKMTPKVYYLIAGLEENEARPKRTLLAILCQVHSHCTVELRSYPTHINRLKCYLIRMLPDKNHLKCFQNSFYLPSPIHLFAFCLKYILTLLPLLFSLSPAYFVHLKFLLTFPLHVENFASWNKFFSMYIIKST